MRWVWCVVLILMTTAARAQESLPDAPAPRPPEPATAIPLHSSAEKSLSLQGFSAFGAAQCDAKGNLYFKIGPALVDPTSGDILRLYEPDEELGNNSVCFTGDAFTFLRMRNGYLRLLTASVH